MKKHFLWKILLIAILNISIPCFAEQSSQYFEKGTLRLFASDNDGPARVQTFIGKWNDQARKWETVVKDRYTRDGQCEYALVPGIYQLRMYYQEAVPEEKRVIEGIQITDKGVIEKREYFEKGKLQLTATDNDGWARVQTFVGRWNDETRKWETVVKDRYTRDGRSDYSLSPGVYQLRMYYQEAAPEEKRVIEGIQISDKGVIEKKEYFEKGTLQFTATDNDGWARVQTFVGRWNDETRKWDTVIKDRYTRDGRSDYSLRPGIYQLRMYYQEAEPEVKRVIDDINIVDRQTSSIGESFGGGNLPPIISAAGPFEIGDGDGFYEMGEKVLFRIEIRDSDLDSIEFLVNDRVIRTLKGGGKYQQTLNLSVPGEYRFAVRAKDKAGNMETFGRTVPVNMQKERTPLSAKSLPIDYGKKRVMMKCPKCNKEYADEIHYCPTDGTKLNPVEKLIHTALDATLIRSGIDPRLPEAKHAKQLGLDWLNPFASQEKIDQDIQQLVDDVIKK